MDPTTHWGHIYHLHNNQSSNKDRAAQTSNYPQQLLTMVTSMLNKNILCHDLELAMAVKFTRQGNFMIIIFNDILVIDWHFWQINIFSILWTVKLDSRKRTVEHWWIQICIDQDGSEHWNIRIIDCAKWTVWHLSSQIYGLWKMDCLWTETEKSDQ